MKGGWVYIMTDRPHGTLYVGVTSDPARRVDQHRRGDGSDFCRRYGLTRLVWAERADDIRDAIAREKAMKAWKRIWKPSLVSRANPNWLDLYGTLHT